MIEKWSLPYPAYTGQEDRNVYVYVPESFEEDDGLRYPVLYMFDGHNVFFDEDATYGKSWGLKAFMDQSETQMMIVAVECNHNPQNGRLSEYAPFSFSESKLGRIQGRGRETMDWFVKTLKPIIDEKYPTIPGRGSTFIAGSSMGGLMSLYAVTQYNAVFSRAAALSPSIWCASRSLDQLFRTAKLSKNTVIYMDYGSKEMRNHANMPKRFAAVTRILLERGVCLTSRIVRNGSHCEASWEKQIPFFINTLLYDWQP